MNVSQVQVAGGISIVALLVLAIVAVVVTALLAMLARSGRAGRIAAVVVGLLLALSLVSLAIGIVLPVASLRHVNQASPHVTVTTPSAPPLPNQHRDATALVQSHPQILTNPDVWQTAPSQRFEADVYPSVEVASKALARELADVIVPDDVEPGLLAVLVEDGASPGLGLITEEALRRVLPAVTLVSRAGGPQDIWSLTADYQAAKGPDTTGRLIWRLSGGGPDLSVAVRDKPWVTDPNWHATATLGHPAIVGYSTGLFTDPAAAERSAIDAAATRIRHTTPASALPQPATGQRTLDPGEIQVVIQDAVLAHQLVRDRFVQRIDRPYGQLYRAAVLVDQGSQARTHLHTAIQNTLDQTRRAAQQQQRRQTTQWVSVGALLVLVLLVYTLLNTLTKHYYLWQLRAVACMVAIAGLLVIFTRL